jgi:hypothetical protein
MTTEKRNAQSRERKVEVQGREQGRQSGLRADQVDGAETGLDGSARDLAQETAGSFSEETGRILKSARKDSPPIFTNLVMAETFDSLHRRGDLHVYPRTDGQYAIVDDRRPFGRRTIAIFKTLREADAELERIANAG